MMGSQLKPGFAPFLVFVICAAATSIYAYRVHLEVVRERETTSQVDAQNFIQAITAGINMRVRALERMKSRWIFQKGKKSKSAWMDDAKNHYDHQPGYQALEWVDNTNVVRWIYPVKGNEPAQGLKLTFEGRRKRALLKSQADLKPHFTAPVELVQGGLGILAFFPLNEKPNQNKGFLLAVFKVKPLFNALLAESNIDGFSFKLSDSDMTAFESEEFQDALQSGLLKAEEAHVFGRVWHLDVVQSNSQLALRHPDHSTKVLVVGGLISVLLSIVAYLLRASRARTRQLNEALKTKSEFLAVMSHEIRTPLNLILGVSEILDEMLANHKEASGYTKRLKSASGHLLALLNDVLNFSKIESKQVKLNKRVLDLRVETENILTLFRQQASEKGLEFEVYFDSRIQGGYLYDLERTNQILVNLLGNAVKFTTVGKVSIKVFPLKDQVVFEVADTGIGIEKSRQKAIFERFSQASQSINTRFGGTGLGLAISIELAKALGGTIAIDSDEGKGSVFSFFLPAENKKLSSSKTVTNPALLPAANLLVVDDSEDNLALMEAFLRKTKCRVTFARNGHEAFELFCKQDFDLVLMDMQMPIMDGRESTRSIREWETKNELDRTPIIALSAESLEEQIESALAAGCDSHLSKPISKKALFEAIASHTELKGQIAA